MFTLAFLVVPSRSYPFPDALPLFDFGFPAFLFLTALFCFWRALRHFRTRPDRCCPKCLYDMRAATSLTCSECGNTVSSDSQLTSHRRFYLRWVSFGLFALVVPLVLVVCFLIAFVQARHSNREVQRAQSLAPYPYAYRFDPAIIPPPPPWVLRAANFIDPNYVNTDQYSLPAAYFIHFTQPFSLATLYLRSSEVAEVDLNNPTVQQVRDAASFPTLYVVKMDYPQGTPIPQPSDFYSFSAAKNLETIDIDFPDADTTALDAVLKNKPRLTTVNLNIPNRATLVHDAFSALTHNSPNLQSLDFRSEIITDADLALLTRCPRLENLILNDVSSQGSGIQALQSLTCLRDLRIELTNPNTIPQCVRAVSSLASLNELIIGVPHGAPSSPGEYAPLAALTNVQQLALRQTPLSDADLVLLKPMTQLQVLEIRSPNGTSDGSGLSAALAGKANLSHIVFEGFPKLRDENLHFLQSLTNLKSFRIDGSTSLTGSFLQYLPARPIESLGFLKCSFTGIPNIDHARVVEITFHDCSPLDPAVFANLAHHPSIEKLHIEKTSLSDLACPFIAQMPALREIDVYNVSLKGLEALMASKSLKTIKCHSITPAEKASLQPLNPAISLQ
jgi:hypothetical protein